MTELITRIGNHESRPFSQAVRAGGLLFVSGQASVDRESGEFIPGTFEEEFNRSVANLDAVLAAAGLGRDSIVKINAFVRDEADLGQFNALYMDEFDHPRPARTTASMGFGFLRFELDCIAATRSAGGEA